MSVKPTEICCEDEEMKTMMIYCSFFENIGEDGDEEEDAEYEELFSHWSS